MRKRSRLGVALGDLGKLREIGLAHSSVLVDALQVRLVPAADKIEFGGPSDGGAAHEAERLDKVRPIRSGGGWRREGEEFGRGIVAAGDAIERARSGRRSDAGRS